MQVRASHILVETEQQAQSLMEQVKNGANFADLARQHSRCPSSRAGGDLGQFGRGQMVPEFEQAAFDNPVGALVGPVRTQFGYHLVLRTA
jgi:peptidyl-prolyl cis-trans isomerase C